MFVMDVKFSGKYKFPPTADSSRSGLAKRTKKTITHFFDFRPFTRIIQWGKDFQTAKDYLIKNQMEVFGLRPKEKPKQRERT